MSPVKRPMASGWGLVALPALFVLQGCPPFTEGCSFGKEANRVYVRVSASTAAIGLRMRLCDTGETTCDEVALASDDDPVWAEGGAGAAFWKYFRADVGFDEECRSGPFEVQIVAANCAPATASVGRFDPEARVEVALECVAADTPCSDDADCPDATPVCDVARGVCGQCATGRTAACTSASAPACAPEVGRCVECAAGAVGACAGPTPACDVSAYRCVECTDGSAASCTGDRRVCDPESKTCVECLDDSGCPAERPKCVAATQTCVACHEWAGTGEACPDEAPFCQPTGACGRCTRNAECEAGVCHFETGRCMFGTPCEADSACDDAEYCSAAAGGEGACEQKLGNGVSLPGSPQALASCSADVGRKVCASGVCDPSDDACGVVTGSACTFDRECRSGRCEQDTWVCVAR